jgi:hypothetical protein
MTARRTIAARVAVTYAVGFVSVWAALWSAACGGGSTQPTQPGQPTTPGTPGGSTPPPVSTAVYPEFTTGAAPLVIIAPHGGDLAPETIPDRTCSGCTTVNDANTQDLARQIADSFAARSGRRPWLVINRLHRRKFDANREVIEATGGYAPLEPVWLAFHASIDSARASIGRSPGRGLVIDLHGHGHAIARLELGYLLSDAALRLTDSALVVQGAMSRTSIARLAAERAGAVPGVALLRGAPSLGALLVTAGYPAVPSPTDVAPLVGEAYFEGGYNTDRHGSLRGGPTDAIQIECHLTGVRDTAANRGAFAGALAAALDRYLRDQYGWVP